MSKKVQTIEIVLLPNIPLKEQVPAKRTGTYNIICPKCNKQRLFFKSEKLRECSCKQKLKIGDITKKGIVIEILTGVRNYKVQCPECKTINCWSSSACKTVKCKCQRKANAKYKIGDAVNTNRILEVKTVGKYTQYVVECIVCNNKRDIQTSSSLGVLCKKCTAEAQTIHKVGEQYSNFIILKSFYGESSRSKIHLVYCLSCNNHRTGDWSTLTKYKCQKCINKEKGIINIGQSVNGYTILDVIHKARIVQHKCGYIFLSRSTGSNKNIIKFRCLSCNPFIIHPKKILNIEEEYKLAIDKMEDLMLQMKT